MLDERLARHTISRPSGTGKLTLFIYVLFEQVLEMELYRGLIYRLSAGYNF